MRALSLPLSLDSFAAVMNADGRAALLDLAVEVFNRLPRFSCPQTTPIYNALLSALYRDGNFHGTYALVRRMARQNVPPDRQTFVILIDAWCAAGNLREAQDMLEEMSQRGFKPPVRGRDLLIDGLVRAGYLESAKDMVRRMTKGLLPDVSTFNSLQEVQQFYNSPGCPPPLPPSPGPLAVHESSVDHAVHRLFHRPRVYRPAR